jgi:hypothetical protein
LDREVRCGQPGDNDCIHSAQDAALADCSEDAAEFVGGDEFLGCFEKEHAALAGDRKIL